MWRYKLSDVEEILSVICYIFTDNYANNFYVRILYQNTSDMTEPYAMAIPNCGTLCDFTTFTEIYGHLISVDWEADCKEVCKKWSI